LEGTEINSFLDAIEEVPPDWNGIVGILTRWMVWRLNASGGKISCTCPDWLWVSSSLLYNGTRSLSLTPVLDGVKERVELYFYSLLSLPCPVLG
jgi:hypothetical protein